MRSPAASSNTDASQPRLASRRPTPSPSTSGCRAAVKAGGGSAGTSRESTAPPGGPDEPGELGALAHEHRAVKHPPRSERSDRRAATTLRSRGQRCPRSLRDCSSRTGTRRSHPRRLRPRAPGRLHLGRRRLRHRQRHAAHARRPRAHLARAGRDAAVLPAHLHEPSGSSTSSSATAPSGYHLTNVLLHAAERGARLARARAGWRCPGAWLAAAVFALHPVHVESVAWITERKNLLSGACYLAALLIALGTPAAPPVADRRERPWLALALFVAALLAKTVTCTLAGRASAARWWRHGAAHAPRRRATLPLFAVGFASRLVTIWMERTHVGARGARLESLAARAALLIAGRALWFYLATLLWPHPLSFVIRAGRSTPATWWQWLFPLAAAAVALVLWLGRARFGRWPLVARRRLRGDARARRSASSTSTRCATRSSPITTSTSRASS